MDEQRPIYQVVELNRAIKQCLEGAFGLVWVEGEVSNVRTPQSGHCYFTLKDAQAQIRAIFFRGAQTNSDVAIRHGEKIRVHGQLTVYEKGGRLSAHCAEGGTSRRRVPAAAVRGAEK